MAGFSGSHRRAMEDASRVAGDFFGSKEQLMHDANISDLLDKPYHGPASEVAPGARASMEQSLGRMGAFGVPGRPPRIPYRPLAGAYGAASRALLGPEGALLAGLWIGDQFYHYWAAIPDGPGSYDLAGAGFTMLCGPDIPPSIPTLYHKVVYRTSGIAFYNCAVTEEANFGLSPLGYYGFATIPAGTTEVAFPQSNQDLPNVKGQNSAVWYASPPSTVAVTPVQPKKSRRFPNPGDFLTFPDAPPASTPVPMPRGSASGSSPWSSPLRHPWPQGVPQDPETPPPGSSGGAGSSGEWGPKPDPQGNRDNDNYKLPTWEIIWKNHPQNNGEYPPPEPPKTGWHYLRVDDSHKIKVPKWLFDLLKLYHGATEVKDFFEALAGAIPGNPCNDPRGFVMAACVMEHFGDIDWRKAVRNIITNEVEDQIVGRSIGQLGKITEAGGPNTVQMTQFLRPAGNYSREVKRRMK